jgi:hypothetical protein
MPPVRRCNQFHQLSSFERERIIGLRKAGFSAQDRYLTIMALRDCHNSRRRVGDEWFDVEGWPIHMRSISRTVYIWSCL